MAIFTPRACETYVEALEQGRIPGDRLFVFVGEQHRIIESDLPTMALVVPMRRSQEPASK